MNEEGKIAALGLVNVFVYFIALCVVGYGIKELSDHATLTSIAMFSLGFTILIPAMILTIYLKLNDIQHSILKIIDKDYEKNHKIKEGLNLEDTETNKLEE